MYSEFGLYIDGAWEPAHNGATLSVFSPVSEQVVGQAPAASTDDTARAITAAEAGLKAWSATPAFTRADALHAVADEMIRRTTEAGQMMATETGKPIAQAEREWGLATDQFRWYAEEARRIYGRIVESRVPGGRFEITREPVGVVGAFTAWNFPAFLVARKLAPALAAGCSVVLRPSSQTPGTAMLLVDCLKAANLPKGTVNLVVGGTSETYGPIMAAKSVRKVSLTGSTRVGQQMIADAAATVKKVSMELGGNAPSIIFDDADLEMALDVSVATKFANCGQVCVTPDRFFVHESLHEAFVDGFAKRAGELVLGDGLNPDVQMGPLINSRALDAALACIDEAVADGAKIVAGGKRPANQNTGHFLEPTVLTNVNDNARVFADENFGPIAAITTFSDEDDVIARANDSDMGLSAYAFTADPDRARRLVAALKSGMVGINSYALAASEAPFGGTNFSGMGREGGTEGIEDYLDTKLAQIVF
ncbi:NAD-dependent succinate-semialdehyde dehydrogenase [Phaeobacter italicus]|uniref:NAD-dependent succinate-semialdehyde dehydrogenase n=1 Tax=Phaeobacter italicus TaxID=481446 RepID=UPI001ADCA9C6|nr:NAD-dependent succinate-semialdehyde dehydrogenase [Phaeobacter italicus]MBO9443886.1 NAD-dependent succinate-semialdehyde dehydrogenase [Phaeobacter italicus]